MEDWCVELLAPTDVWWMPGGVVTGPGPMRVPAHVGEVLVCVGLASYVALYSNVMAYVDGRGVHSVAAQTISGFKSTNST